MTTKDEAREQLKELLWDVHHGRRQPLAALIDAEQFAAAACQPSTLEMLEALASRYGFVTTRGLHVLSSGDGFLYSTGPTCISRDKALTLLKGGGDALHS